MTADEHRDLTERLVAVADAPAPSVGFDTAWAVRQGRARLRRRRRASIGGAAVLTAAVLTGTLLLEPGAGDGPVGSPVPVAPAATPTTADTPADSAARTPGAAGASPTAVPPAVGDPLASEVRFGWLPAWAAGVGYQAGTHGQAATAGGGNDHSPMIRLSLFPAGPEPAVDSTSAFPQVKSPAPPVDGRTAYWLTRQGSAGDHILRWLTPSGRWAQLYWWGGKPADYSDETLLRIAAGASFGAWDVPLPLWFAGLTEPFRPENSSIGRPANSALPWFAEIEFRVEGRTVEVTVSPDVEPVPGDTVLGPASPTCRTEQGLKVCAAVSDGAAPAALEQLGGLNGLLGLVRVTGLDEGTWTTDVLRR
ncbi:hypothetical protein [Kitasatospora sp. NPDC002965]|uniref:hypothetical protein n=1 Tax=Kitasatospora sp. NPDC002965 TaxID=3154775 RepID=UPI0033BBC0FD